MEISVRAFSNISNNFSKEDPIQRYTLTIFKWEMIKIDRTVHKTETRASVCPRYLHAITTIQFSTLASFHSLNVTFYFTVPSNGLISSVRASL